MSAFLEWWTSPEAVRGRIRMGWYLLAQERGKRGAAALAVRRGAYRALRAAYATPAGASIGLGERLSLANSVWPQGKVE